MELKFNIAIVGSGLTGSITSLALAKAGYKVALIDPKGFEEFKENNYDTRTTALSKKSKLFFEYLDLWQHMKPFTCMIKNIMVNDGDPQKNIYFNKTQRKKNNYKYKFKKIFNYFHFSKRKVNSFSSSIIFNSDFTILISFL